jgi:Zn-finger nucleic acid-binding protein
MDCPVCKNAMITMELCDVEIDYCTGCKGIWLDEGEMELLLGEGEQARDLISSFAALSQTKEIQRKCPICDKKMEKITAGQGPNPVLLDRCTKGDGLWFDGGELNTIIQQAKLDEGNKIKQVLADMFGQKTEDS